MANKGTLNGKQFITEETWNEFHSEQKEEMIDDFYPTMFDKGGCCHFGMTDEQLGKTKKIAK